jgi:hypothetical protein
LPSLGDPDQSAASLPQFYDPTVPPVGDQAAGFGLEQGGKRLASFARCSRSWASPQSFFHQRPISLPEP